MPGCETVESSITNAASLFRQLLLHIAGVVVPKACRPTYIDMLHLGYYLYALTAAVYPILTKTSKQECISERTSRDSPLQHTLEEEDMQFLTMIPFDTTRPASPRYRSHAPLCSAVNSCYAIC